MALSRLADPWNMGPSDDFLARMSHEMRTPLSAILGLCEIVLEGDLDPRQRELLERVAFNGESLLTLVQGLLDAARIEAGEVVLDEEPFDLRAVVERTVRGLGANVGPDVLLLCRVDPELPDRLVGDPARLRQVLVNLVGNAIKFTEQGCVRVQAVVHDKDPGCCWLELHVSDTGPGISDGDQERIFDRFVQADAGERLGGSGLGLSIARTLVETMGGNIDVESTLGEGSAFRVWLQLPIAEERCSARSQSRDVVRGASLIATGLAPEEVRLFEDLGVEVRTDGWIGELRLRSSEPGVDGEIELTRPLTESRLVEHILELHGESLSRREESVREDRLELLVVEDNPDNAEVSRRALRPMGGVYVVPNGARALEVMEERSFDAVVLDLHMPVMDGFETLKRIRARELRQGGARVPVLAFSAHATEEVQARCRKLGVTAFLAKPAGAARIREAVQELVDPRPVVLIADDAPAARHIARHYLEAEGYRCIEAENGLRALYVLRERRVDVVLADWEMPVLDGIDVAQRLRADDRYAQVPLLAMTGHATDAAIAEARSAGFDRILAKPVRREVLQEAIRGALQRPGAEVVQVDPDIEDLVPAYLDGCREDARRLQAALDSGDLEGCRKIGHALKGTGGAYGFSRLTELGAVVEASGRARDLEGCREAVEALEHYLHAVVVRYAS